MMLLYSWQNNDILDHVSAKERIITRSLTWRGYKVNDKINTTHAMFINWMPPFIEVIKEKGGSATSLTGQSSILRGKSLLRLPSAAFGL